MSEINNLPPQRSGLDKAKLSQIKSVDEITSQCEAEECCHKNNDIAPSFGILGQSQVKSENPITDTEFCMKNPQLMNKCDAYFDRVYEKLNAENDPYAYEKACTLTKAFADELKN